MAENTPNALVYFLKIEAKYKDYLQTIRHWDNLKVGIDGNNIWVKNFTEKQVSNAQFQAIPFTKVFTEKMDLLFRIGSLLPDQKTPILLWTPIEKALPISSILLNQNFFGIAEKLEIKLVPSEEEHSASGLLVDIEMANEYIQTAPAFRLQLLSWTLVGKQKALILGEPLLPINGDIFWRKGNFLFPAGLQLEYPILEEEISEIMSKNANSLIWWLSEKEYCNIDTFNFQPLTIASWRKSI
ncbi:MAG: hypothetical protein KA313_02540 [Pseudarcicella sp.]|nr:hypothetical protein [Pseudarcicella sp.]MBP6409957.1 hypothetical protein [Pseudarcicella sp.]